MRQFATLSVFFHCCHSPWRDFSPIQIAKAELSFIGALYLRFGPVADQSMIGHGSDMNCALIAL